MIGDSETDIEAGLAASTLTIRLGPKGTQTRAAACSPICSPLSGRAPQSRRTAGPGAEHERGHAGLDVLVVGDLTWPSDVTASPGQSLHHNARTHVSRLTRLVALPLSGAVAPAPCVVALVLTIVSWPVTDIVPQAGLDPSWQSGLAMALSQAFRVRAPGWTSRTVPSAFLPFPLCTTGQLHFSALLFFWYRACLFSRCSFAQHTPSSGLLACSCRLPNWRHGGCPPSTPPTN